MNEQKLFLIIDGSSLLSTSFFATASSYLMARTDEDKEKALTKLLKTSDGRYTNGVYTFMKTLIKLVKDQKPSHMAIVWDISRNSFRRTELSSDYKGTRKETPHPLKEQFKTTQDILQGIFPQFISSFDDEVIYEADDFAGSLCKKFEDEIPCVLYTKDEDYLQLISEYSRVWLVTSKADAMFEELGINRNEFNVPTGAFDYTLTSLMDIKELEPYQIVEYKALSGDSSDNIPGVKGVGPKAALPLLKEYGDIETIYDIIDDLDDKEQKELAKFFKESLGISRSPIKNLLAGKDSAFLSKKLATIKTDIPSIESVTFEDIKLNIDNELLKNRLLDLEIKTLI